MTPYGKDIATFLQTLYSPRILYKLCWMEGTMFGPPWCRPRAPGHFWDVAFFGFIVARAGWEPSWAVLWLCLGLFEGKKHCAQGIRATETVTNTQQDKHCAQGEKPAETVINTQDTKCCLHGWLVWRDAWTCGGACKRLHKPGRGLWGHYFCKRLHKSTLFVESWCRAPTLRNHILTWCIAEKSSPWCVTDLCCRKREKNDSPRLCAQWLSCSWSFWN